MKKICLVLLAGMMTLTAFAACERRVPLNGGGGGFSDSSYNESVSSLSNKYRQKEDNGLYTFYLEFKSNGELEIVEDWGSFGGMSITCSYKIEGEVLIISNLGYNYGCPISKDGEYTFRKEGNSIFINDEEWVLSR